jgi:hypothetical protein
MARVQLTAKHPPLRCSAAKPSGPVLVALTELEIDPEAAGQRVMLRRPPQLRPGKTIRARLVCCTAMSRRSRAVRTTLGRDEPGCGGAVALDAYLDRPLIPIRARTNREVASSAGGPLFPELPFGSRIGPRGLAVCRCLDRVLTCTDHSSTPSRRGLEGPLGPRSRIT